MYKLHAADSPNIAGPRAAGPCGGAIPNAITRWPLRSARVAALLPTACGLAGSIPFPAEDDVLSYVPPDAASDTSEAPYGTSRRDISSSGYFSSTLSEAAEDSDEAETGASPVTSPACRLEHCQLIPCEALPTRATSAKRLWPPAAECEATQQRRHASMPGCYVLAAPPGAVAPAAEAAPSAAGSSSGPPSFQATEAAADAVPTAAACQGSPRAGSGGGRVKGWTRIHQDDMSMARVLMGVAAVAEVPPLQLLTQLLDFPAEQEQELQSQNSCVYQLMSYLHNMRTVSDDTVADAVQEEAEAAAKQKKATHGHGQQQQADAAAATAVAAVASRPLEEMRAMVRERYNRYLARIIGLAISVLESSPAGQACALAAAGSSTGEDARARALLEQLTQLRTQLLGSAGGGGGSHALQGPRGGLPAVGSARSSRRGSLSDNGTPAAGGARPGAGGGDAPGGRSSDTGCSSSSLLAAMAAAKSAASGLPQHNAPAAPGQGRPAKWARPAAQPPAVPAAVVPPPPPPPPRRNSNSSISDTATPSRSSFTGSAGNSGPLGAALLADASGGRPHQQQLAARGGPLAAAAAAADPQQAAAVQQQLLLLVGQLLLQLQRQQVEQQMAVANNIQTLAAAAASGDLGWLAAATPASNIPPPPPAAPWAHFNNHPAAAATGATGAAGYMAAALPGALGVQALAPVAGMAPSAVAMAAAASGMRLCDFGLGPYAELLSSPQSTDVQLPAHAGVMHFGMPPSYHQQQNILQYMM